MDGLLSFLNANKTDAQLLTLSVMFVVIFMYIWIRLVGLYYKVRFKRIVDSICQQYADRIKELEEKLKSYERTHRTMV